MTAANGKITLDFKRADAEMKQLRSQRQSDINRELQDAETPD